MASENGQERRETLSDIVDAARHTQGNAAAMREALELALDALISWLNGTIDRTTNRETIKAILAALSAPARNCDLYDNEDEVESAYVEFRQREVDKVPLDALDYSKETGKIPGKIKWLLAPAAERKGDGDGR